MNVAPRLPRSTEAAPAFASAGQRPSAAHALILLLVSLFLTVPGISSVPPIDRDEARYVQATKQMVETGDYVDIRFQEASRYKKPVGIYWMQAAAVAVSGDGADAPIWVYRTVSGLGIALAVLALYWSGAALFGRDAGIVAALVFAALFASAFEGRVAKTDAMLVGLVVLAQGALAQIYVARRAGAEPAAHLKWVFWAAQGVGILVKGPIAPLVSVLTIAALAAYDRDWRWLKALRAGRGILLALLIVLPWLGFITWKSGGAFWQESVGKDLLSKVGDAQESHGAPPGYYVLTFSLFFWPFGLFAMGAWSRAFERLRSDPRLAFCVAWNIPLWLLLEAIPTKLPHYIMPAYPAQALVAGWFITLAASEIARPLPKTQLWFLRATAFGHIVVTAGLAAVAVGLSLALHERFVWWGVPAAALILLTGWLAWPRAGRLALGRIAAATLSAGAAYAALFGLVLPSQTAMWIAPRVAASLDVNARCPAPPLAAVGFHEPSLVFLAGTRTALTDPAGAAAALAADPRCGLALVPVDREGELRAALGAAGPGLEQVDRVDGLNYSSGDRLSLGLYRVADR